MIPLFRFTTCWLVIPLLCLSCQPEEESAGAPPVPIPTVRANAGLDQTITLPQDSVVLDGSRSTVSHGTITTYTWAKVAGPAPFQLQEASAVRTRVRNLVRGEYDFALTVTAPGGATSTDVVRVVVAASPKAPMALQHWTRYGDVPVETFSSGSFPWWFGGSNFLLGIGEHVVAISKKGHVWGVAGAPVGKRLNSFPERLEQIPVVFSLQDKGYCLGRQHLWQYDVGLDTWQRKQNVPLAIQDARVALVLGEQVYVVDGVNSQVRRYDPATDTYAPSSDFPGSEATTGFVIGNQGFCLGADGRCWAYEPSTDRWLPKASLPPSVFFLTGFAAKGQGYVLGDLNHTAYNQNQPLNLWQYDASLDQWRAFAEAYPGQGVYVLQAVPLQGGVLIGLGLGNGDWNTLDLWLFR